MERVETVFEKEKETKNTVRFQEKPKGGKPPIIGVLYVQKWLNPDDTIRVTIEGAK